MSGLYLTLTIDTLNQAICDLDAKATAIASGVTTAARHFETLIGSAGHPDTTPEAQVSRLEAVRFELMKAMVDISNDLPTTGLSEEAIAVLSNYEEATARPRLDVEHIRFGAGFPSAQLILAATRARADLALILQAITEELDPPKRTYLSYFEAYEDEIGTDAFEKDDDLWFISTSIEYLSALIENPQLAWKNEIEIPAILFDHVLSPCIDKTRKLVRYN